MRGQDRREDEEKVITLEHYDRMRAAVTALLPHPKSQADYPVKVDTFAFEDVDEVTMTLELPDGSRWIIRCEMPKEQDTEQAEQEKGEANGNIAGTDGPVSGAV